MHPDRGNRRANPFGGPINTGGAPRPAAGPQTTWSRPGPPPPPPAGPPPEPATERIAQPVEDYPDFAEPASTTPALVEADGQYAALVHDYQYAADIVERAATEIVEAFIGSHRDTRPVLDQMAATHESVIRTFREHFGPAPYASGTGTATQPNQWIASAQDLIGRLNARRVPFTRTGRDQQQKEFTTETQQLLSTYEPTLKEFALLEWRYMVSAGSARAEAIYTSALSRSPMLPLPPPPIGPYPQPVDRELVSGPGPLKVFLGQMTPRTVWFNSTAQGGHGNDDHFMTIPELAIPVVVDLDAIGSFVVTEAECLETPILNLLSALPANQLQLPVFDPEHGGNSAKFLYGLGDSAERIIGDRVKTSDRELNDLLQSTEEHITFVTQRFLQGEHSSLTEYNRAAGEVAEPYRMLLLYDFPSGFARGGHYDRDQLERLQKIIRNGPRAGVFTVLVIRDKAVLTDAIEKRNNNFSVGTDHPLEHVTKVIRELPWFISGGGLTHHTLQRLAGQPGGVRVVESTGGAHTHSGGAQVSAGTVTWRFEPGALPSAPVASSLLDSVKRNLHTADDVRVTPERVAELAHTAQQSAAATFGERFVPTVARPDKPETWWRATSDRGVTGHFGRIGARQVADLILDSEVNTFGALIGGRPGSGKSVLLHAVIMSIAIEYPPSEVELFLIDFKEGVEFKQYADEGLPHARVIAIESERDFGLSVLQNVAREINRRGELFRNEGGGATNLREYRARTRQPLKRLVLIIDEFQQLFYRDDKIAAESAEILELVLRQGRAFGIHVILASQSLAGLASLGKHVLGFIPTRIALQSSESDSRLVLGEENTDAQTLSRAGEGILNRKGGHKDANERFQAAFWDPDARSAALRLMTQRARSARMPDITTVFAGHEPADVTTVPFDALVPPQGDARHLGIPVGLPLTLDADPLFTTLRRDAGSNLLIVDEQGGSSLAIAIASVQRQGAAVELLDFGGDENDWPAVVDELGALDDVRVGRRKAAGPTLTRLAGLVNERQEMGEYRSRPIVLALAAMGRARDFDPNSYDDDALTNLLGTILKDGPEVGVHVLCWFDRPAGIGKRVSSSQLNEFGQRLVGVLNRDDSSQLIDSENAASLKSGQGICADLDRAAEYRIRRFAPPPLKWFTAMRTEG
ncbi:FtsK/SpoIIIE family protein [Mycolicibacterium rutilum]|uniref:FtsK/SpoIIIE family protein n=1 Tax=Mycolicibacterium rutilum TaxID=370526 RepID=A0A1H6IND5_MYCRU|nr:FtsK/SpoIIIE domain-containing protein [Mycolicibacterium rutilum]SEH48065.1 FtsK/SpoIIIE family protein [Mycolicibacterium rutilum]